MVSKQPPVRALCAQAPGQPWKIVATGEEATRLHNELTKEKSGPALEIVMGNVLETPADLANRRRPRWRLRRQGGGTWQAA